MLAPWVGLVGQWQRETESLLSPTPVGVAVGGTCEPPAKRPRIGNVASESVIDTPLPLCGLEIRRDFYALRSQSALISLSHFLSHIFSARLLSHSGTTSSPDQTTREAKPFQLLMKEFQMDKILNEHANSLVGVIFEMLHRGNAGTNNIITTPILSDLKNLSDSQKNIHGPEEPLCSRGVTVVESDVVCVGVSGLSRKERCEVQRERKKKVRGNFRENKFRIPRNEG